MKAFHQNYYFTPIETTCLEYLKNNLKNLKVKKLEKIIDQCEKLLPKIKRRLKNKDIKHNLTDDELFSILIYTYDLGCEDNKKNFYYIFNEMLRKRSVGEIKPWLGYIHFLFKALDKLPNEDTDIYRGINNDEINKIYKDEDLKNQLVIWSGFTSGSKNKNAAKQFATEKGIIFKIITNHGKFISPFSCIENEDEIVILPNSTFEVLKTSKIKNGYCYIVLHQKKDEVVKKVIVDKKEIEK
jgi:hypothetical protein